jgi:nicotinamide riboside kinase
MKIGILGTACAGKTTLAKQLAEYFEFDIVNEVAREYFAEHLELESVQYDVLFKQIKNEMFAGKNVITDRTIIDNYIHIDRAFKPKMYLLNLVRAWSQTYDVILLCKKLPFVDDGFRLDRDMEADMIQFMQCNLIDYEVIEGNETERFLNAVKIIKNN